MFMFLLLFIWCSFYQSLRTDVDKEVRNNPKAKALGSGVPPVLAQTLVGIWLCEGSRTVSLLAFQHPLREDS